MATLGEWDLIHCAFKQVKSVCPQFYDKIHDATIAEIHKAEKILDVLAIWHTMELHVSTELLINA